MIGWLVVLVLLVASPAWAACSSGPGANTWTAATADYAEVNDCVLNAASGDTIHVPAGTKTWTLTLSPANKYVSIIGAGIGNTVITQGDGTKYLIDWTTIDGNPAAANGGLSRISGFTFYGATTFDSNNRGILNISGVSSRVRIDHNKLYKITSSVLKVSHYARGVFDNNIVDGTLSLSGTPSPTTVTIYIQHAVWNVPGSGRGDASWAAPDSYGTGEAFYFETNTFQYDPNGKSSCTGFILDGWNGSRVVSRFNHYVNYTHSSGHCTESSQRERCRRSFESYENDLDWNFTGCTGTKTKSPVISGRTSTMLVWNNDVTTAGGATVLNPFDTEYPRGDNDFNPWGVCRRNPISSITHSGTTVTVNTTTDHGWGTVVYSPGQIIHVKIAGVTPTAYNGIWPLATVPSGTQLTYVLPSDPGTDGSGGYTASPYDGDQNSTGWPCIDQAGRGRDAEMLTSETVPKLPSTGKPGWPNQAFSPGFYLNNRLNGTIRAPGLSDGGGHIAFDRDVWAGTFGEQTSADGCATSCLPFNGTTGAGHGRIERRPTTCTTGVIYRATNQGTWNAVAEAVLANSSGKFYRCQNTNSWAAWYGTNNISGEPYLYPHPLITGDDPVPPPPTPSAPTGFEIIP